MSPLVGLVLGAGCDFSSRSDAVKNTAYASDLVGNGVNSSEELALGMRVEEVLEIMGDPVSAKRLALHRNMGSAPDVSPARS
jgi:hypothetical protein